MSVRIAGGEYADHISVVAIAARPLIRAETTQSDDSRGVETIIKRPAPCVLCFRVVAGPWR